MQAPAREQASDNQNKGNTVAMKPSIWLGEDGIVRIRFPDNFHLSLGAVQGLNHSHRELSTERRPVLVHADSVASADYEAQRFASDPLVTEVVSAMAIIVRSVFTRALADLFMKFHRPPYPTRVFTSENEALDWLRRGARD
ncbi:MAG TPA: hypothetical protein ENJ79_07245 [Gammaproteobacteria bacterium]|nr:hypothetical protein [Gammaproteobacteria bacterium]